MFFCQKLYRVGLKPVVRIKMHHKLTACTVDSCVAGCSESAVMIVADDSEFYVAIVAVNKISGDVNAPVFAAVIDDDTLQFSLIRLPGNRFQAAKNVVFYVVNRY